MRYLSLLLISCIITLSSMVTVKSAPVKANVEDCCKKIAGKPSCNNIPSPDQNKGCDKPGCAMMFNCGICGFIAVEQLHLFSPNALSIPDPIFMFTTENTSAYHFSDWKPPKTC